LKSSEQHGQISSVGVPSATLGTGSSTTRGQAPCHDHPSVRRPAKDDDFVVTWRSKKPTSSQISMSPKLSERLWAIGLGWYGVAPSVLTACARRRPAGRSDATSGAGSSNGSWFSHGFFIKLHKIRCFVDGHDLAFGSAAHEFRRYGSGLRVCWR
jgi:hypothetical protein